MKKIVLTLAVLSAAYFVQAQQVNQSEVPEKVKSAFDANTHGATVMSWEKVKSGYKATYSIENNESTALFNSSGKLLEQEFTVSQNDLPDNIVEYLGGVEEKQTINKVIILKDVSGNKSYKVKIHDMYYFFDPVGTFTKKIKS